MIPTTRSYMVACPDVDGLLEIASRNTGLDDFGDPRLRAPLKAYVSGLQTHAWKGMIDFARSQAIDFILHNLETRLKLIADRKTYPEIAQQKIDSPIILVGPPRSGSTLLHTLLNQDPDNRAPEHWLCLEPTPPLALGKPTQERLNRAEKRLASQFTLIPDILVIHPYLIEEGANALAECGSDIMNMAFTTQEKWCFYRNESYRRYLLEGDHRAALGFHHDFLQHLQWGMAEKRWALKGSDYLLWLGEAAAQYPDAKLIWTHRDLAQQLPSLTSAQSVLTGITGNAVSGEEILALARETVELQCASFEKGMRARDAIGEDRFVDVSYHDMMADPIRAVERIYEQIGLTMSGKHRANIDNWIASNPQTKHGIHKHSPEDFVLTAEGVNERFEKYIHRFGFGFGIRPSVTA
jgi:hypothetical protein